MCQSVKCPLFPHSTPKSCILWEWKGQHPDHTPRSFTSLSMVDYTLVKEQLGTVVVDHHDNEYVVYDFKIGCAAYQLWDKKEQAFYYTDYNAFNTFYQQISG